MAKTTRTRPLPEELAAHPARIAATTQTTRKLLMMPPVHHAQTDRVGGHAT